MRSGLIPEQMRFVGMIDVNDLLSAEGLSSMEAVPMTAELSEFDRSRLGMITGSRFNQIKRDRSGKGWSETALSYMYDIIGEHITGIPASEFTGNKATEWGQAWEDAAINEYCRQFRRKVERGTFCRAKGFRLVGCTPDGLSSTIGLEVKCPLSYKNHIRTVISEQVPAEYVDQVNGHMLCTGRKRCVFVSFDPRIERKDLRLKAIEVEYDRNAIEDLSGRLYDFEEAVIEKLNHLGIEFSQQVHR